MTDDKTSKPLRAIFNKGRDLYDTYKKYEPERKPQHAQSETQIEIEDTENLQSEHVEDENIEIELLKSEEKEQDEKILLNDRIQQLEKESEDYKEQLMRKAAEFENFRRRSIREKQDMIDYANERLLFNMLPLLDDMEKAIDSGKISADKDSLLTGLEMIMQKANKIFDESGVKQIDSFVGKPFDVNYHEALMQIPSEFPEGYVVQEVQKGYMIRDKVLRHSKVITSAGENNANS
jgi:molecular chaperone GrpE